jgi:hypothetical protein
MYRYICACALAALALDSNASCGSAFCLVNTNWSAQGAWVEPGARFDLRYEAIDLDQPRTGRDRISVGEIPRHHDEVETKNRNWVAAVDWNLGELWGVSVSLPYVDRQHLHIHNHHGEQLPETWNFTEIGDMRVQARRTLTNSDDPEVPCVTGLTFGLKLPTGKYDVTNDEGEQAERTLQPGTGTTDLLLGYYWNSGAPLLGLSWFAGGQVVLPMNSKAGFKPGKQLQVDGGIRYAASQNVGLMLQVNYVAKGRDSGENAEPEDSGSRQAYVSPGISWNATRDLQLYAYVQLPIYQSVNGVQLTADRSAMAGLSWRF